MHIMKALLIGRFQPFHNGHLKIIQNLSKEFSEVIIGIGSSQYAHALENPFTADERILMIKKSLEKIDIKTLESYQILAISEKLNFVRSIKNNHSSS